jgi:hypothetical protein
MDVLQGRMRGVTVRCEGARVLIIEDGRMLLDVPWEAADALAKALHIQARRAEEEANAEQIVADQAILTRLGVPIGLSNRSDILHEAAKEAAWNSSLRRYIRPARAKGIASQAIFGTPTIITEDRK